MSVRQGRAEEGGGTASDAVWILDPIDGTRDFVGGRPGWAVSVALVSSGRPLIGMLSAPARDEEWVAVAGQGATLNDMPIRASARAVFSRFMSRKGFRGLSWSSACFFRISNNSKGHQTATVTIPLSTHGGHW